MVHRCWLQPTDLAALATDTTKEILDPGLLQESTQVPELAPDTQPVDDMVHGQAPMCPSTSALDNGEACAYG